MNITARATLLALIVLAVLAGVWKVWHAADKAGYQRAQAEAQALATAQAQRNLELQRAAERRYTVVAEVREKVITNTITEIRHATANLAACPVPVPAVRLLNHAAKCASSDSSAACGPGDGLRAPG